MKTPFGRDITKVIDPKINQYHNWKLYRLQVTMTPQKALELFSCTSNIYKCNNSTGDVALHRTSWT